MFARRHRLVSVVVTNYNNAAFIEACLNSLRDQTYRDIEIIVVDDASTDDSRRMIRNWKQENRALLRHRLQLIALPRNVGFAGAVNIGLYLAKGQYIAMQDGDDLSHPRRIEKQVNYLRKHRDIDFLGTNYEWFDSNHPESRQPANWLAFSPKEVKQVYAHGGHCVCHGTLLFRANWFDKYGGPTRRFVGAEDYEMIAKCIRHGAKVTNLRDVLYAYRQHDGQRSHQYYK